MNPWVVALSSATVLALWALVACLSALGGLVRSLNRWSPRRAVRPSDQFRLSFCERARREWWFVDGMDPVHVLRWQSRLELWIADRLWELMR